jgi:DNA-binding NtrC family response regulator
MPDHDALHGYRVLIIEDEYYIAEALKQVLQGGGAEVIGPLADFPQAMARVKCDGFEVAILDVDLRGSSAIPIADELVSRGVPFVFATGYSAAQIPSRFVDVTIWEKPFAEQRVINDIRRICGASHLRRRSRH